MKKWVLGLLAFLLVAAGANLAQAQQEPSLGDLAKQRRDEKKPARVFTNEDVATSSPSAPSVDPKPANASSAAGADKKTDTKDAEKKESASKDAAGSKDSPQVTELKQKLSSFKEQQEGWKKSAKRYQDLLANEPSDFRRQMYQDALQGDQQNIQLFQDKIDQAQADLAKAEKPSSSH